MIRGWGMYRVVSAGLGVMLAASILGAWSGLIGYTPEGILATALAASIGTLATSALGAALTRSRLHVESSLITALLITFIVPPTLLAADLVGALVSGALAGASKYLITWRGRHILNPAATGVTVASLFGLTAGFWWVANPPMTPLILLIGGLIAWRSGFGVVALAALAIGAGGLVVRLGLSGEPIASSLYFILTSYPIWFLALFMLTEPITMAPRRLGQLSVAALVGLGTAFPISVSWGGLSVTSSPELVLVLGNLVAWAWTLRHPGGLAVGAQIAETRRIGERALVTRLELDRPLGHLAGQWVELQIPHRRADGRGIRRVFSISSPPDSAREKTVEFVTTLAEHGSSFKHQLARATPGERVRITRVGGDFVLPSDSSSPIVMVAGGIGVTPFLSQIRDLSNRGDSRSLTLVHARREGEVDPFDTGVPSFVDYRVTNREGLAPTLRAVSGALPAGEPAVWMVSGSPGFVRAVKRTLRPLGARRILTDVFTGY